ncbi:MAG: carboxypeptidase M32, partial [Paracoccaceae bacterium]|nr:carboxypeptidase M32 [Paracoccaceae bacterium]
MSAYQALMSFQRDTEALAQVVGRLGWDQETMMPRGAAVQRGEEMAAMESVMHARRTDPRIADWLEESADEDLDHVAWAQLRHIRQTFDRTCKVPVGLAAEIARVTSVAQGVWVAARAADDFLAFAPTLNEVLALRRQEAAALAEGGDFYDALLDGYETAIKAHELEAMFAVMRPRLVALRAAVLHRPAPAPLTGYFDSKIQMQMARSLAETFGYDMRRGRLDLAVHPFSSGSGDDTRITTRITADDPFNCIYSTIHEVGHAAYEQNISSQYTLTPLGGGVSMGVHESQSRIYENQLGRSRAFTSWMFGKMKDAFGAFGVPDEEAFYATVNRVSNGYIRTEADEVQYNLHIMLRFDLERALISGDLQVRDLEAAWNERFSADFGYAVDKPSHGVLQDVHWSVGLFGYFPTYSLGNVYAGCLYQALRADVPALDDQLAAGDLSAATAWLGRNVHQHGGLYEPQDLIARAARQDLSEQPLLTYLEDKFSDLY